MVHCDDILCYSLSDSYQRKFTVPSWDTPSEGLVDVEQEARLAVFAEAIVQAHVDVFLEFPAVAEAVVGQKLFAYGN